MNKLKYLTLVPLLSVAAGCTDVATPELNEHLKGRLLETLGRVKRASKAIQAAGRNAAGHATAAGDSLDSDSQPLYEDFRLRCTTDGFEKSDAGNAAVFGVDCPVSHNQKTTEFTETDKTTAQFTRTEILDESLRSKFGIVMMASQFKMKSLSDGKSYEGEASGRVDFYGGGSFGFKMINKGEWDSLTGPDRRLERTEKAVYEYSDGTQIRVTVEAKMFQREGKWVTDYTCRLDGALLDQKDCLLVAGSSDDEK